MSESVSLANKEIIKRKLEEIGGKPNIIIKKSEPIQNLEKKISLKKREFLGGLFPLTLEKVPKESLYKAYIDERLSHRECSERFQISKDTIRKLLNYYEIESRNTSEAAVIAHEKMSTHKPKRQTKKKNIKSKHISCNTCAYWEFVDELGVCHGTPPMPRDVYDLEIDRDMEESEREFAGFGKWFWTNPGDWCRLWAGKPIKITDKFHINQELPLPKRLNK